MLNAEINDPRPTRSSYVLRFVFPVAWLSLLSRPTKCLFLLHENQCDQNYRLIDGLHKLREFNFVKKNEYWPSPDDAGFFFYEPKLKLFLVGTESGGLIIEKTNISPDYGGFIFKTAKGEKVPIYAEDVTKAREPISFIVS